MNDVVRLTRLAALPGHDPTCTRGILTFDEPRHQGQIFHTMELPWKDNERDVSCIPDGVYRLTPHKSPSKGKCLKVHDVKGRTHILIHSANCPSQLQGCIAPGLTAGYLPLTAHGVPEPAVLYSRKALRSILDILSELHEYTLLITTAGIVKQCS